MIDAKRGKLFAKLIKNIEVATAWGGVDIEATRLSTTPSRRRRSSRSQTRTSTPRSKRDGGLEAGGADYATIMHEGYGPNGVAVLIECLTDNRNRAASDARVAMTRNGGNMADPGSVSYLFNRKGVVIVPMGELTEDDVLGESFEALSEATDLVAIHTALQDAGIDYDSAEANFVPTMQVELDEGGRQEDLQADRRDRGRRASWAR